MINKEINTTWIIPEQNILDINYTIKEEKNSKIKRESNFRNNFPQLKLESDKKQKNSKLNLSINNTNINQRAKNYTINKEFSLEKKIIHSNTKIKNDKNKSHILKIRNFFFPIGRVGGTHTTIKNTSNDNDNDDDIDEQSYDFQKLFNLNKDKPTN
jgi:hypothetical protein